MQPGLVRTALVLTCLVAAHASAQSDVAGSKDPSLFTRMPGFTINQYEDKAFAAYSFSDKDGNKVNVEGHLLSISYAWPGTGAKPSSLQVLANYENAIRKVGGTTVRKYGDTLTLKLVKEGRETWAEIASEVDAGWGGYIVTIVEKGQMEQQVVANAAAMKADLRASGHVAVYGILFDTGKADIKPESAGALAEIAKLLKQDATLKVHVVGHTDNVGELASNLALSQARAEAVKKALVTQHAVAIARLATFGAGPYCPVASNATPDGRAQNRRVELVQQ